jgi:lipoate-protein ligase A
LKPEYQGLTTEQFRDELIKHIYHTDSLAQAQTNQYQLTEADNSAIDEIENQLYKNWDWVYGKSPKFSIQKRQHFDAGTIDARFQVENGKIANLKIYGDFFGTGDVNDLAQQLTGLKYDPQTIRQVLENVDLNQYFMGIPPR